MLLFPIYRWRLGACKQTARQCVCVKWWISNSASPVFLFFPRQKCNALGAYAAYVLVSSILKIDRNNNIITKGLLKLLSIKIVVVKSHKNFIKTDQNRSANKFSFGFWKMNIVDIEKKKNCFLKKLVHCIIWRKMPQKFRNTTECGSIEPPGAPAAPL